MGAKLPVWHPIEERQPRPQNRTSGGKRPRPEIESGSRRLTLLMLKVAIFTRSLPQHGGHLETLATSLGQCCTTGTLDGAAIRATRHPRCGIVPSCIFQRVVEDARQAEFHLGA